MKINYSYILLILICIFAGYSLELMVFIISLILHEIGHILFIMFFKGKIKRINFNNFGFMADVNLKNVKTLPKLLIYSSGIVMNILIIILFTYIIVLPIEYDHLIIYIVLINKIIIFFNILVIYPLDGYQIVTVLLDRLFDYTYNSTFKIISIISLLNISILFVYSVYIQSFGLIYISIVLYVKNYKKIKQRDKDVLEKIFRLIT